MSTENGREAVVLIIEALVSLQPSEPPKAPEPETPTTSCQCDICAEPDPEGSTPPERGLYTPPPAQVKSFWKEFRASVESQKP